MEKMIRIIKKKNSLQRGNKGSGKNQAWELGSAGLWPHRCNAGLFMNFSELVFSSINYHLSYDVV